MNYGMLNYYSYQRFVIIGTARTGSSLLWSYLNSHPDILCLRGIYGSTNKINFGKFYNDLPGEYHSPELVKERNENPIHFLKNYVFKNYPKPYKAVGFKYFYDHNRHLKNKKELIDYFIDDEVVKFIHIKRENLLATLFSYKRALAHQQWTSANTNYRVEISVSECEDYFVRIVEHQRWFDKLFLGRTFEIIYENFTNLPQQILTELQTFIGVNYIDLKTQMTKNENRKLSEVITNFDELKSHFDKSEYKKYFDE